MKEPYWLSADEVYAIHEEVIDWTGGAAGMRDESLLASAVARPQMAFHYGDFDIIGLASLYTEVIAKNHAFVDGNKRTAVITLDLFLRKNGIILPVEQRNEQYALIDGIASGAVSREALVDYLRLNVEVIQLER